MARPAEQDDHPSSPATPDATALPLEVERRGGWRVARFAEASLMDVTLIEALHARILALVAEGPVDVLLDFRGVEYVSSSMFGVLVAIREAVGKAGGRLVLCGLNDRLLRLLKLARLDAMFEIADDVDCAVAS